jgi:membrane protein DedA with SNARE-associated domain
MNLHALVDAIARAILAYGYLAAPLVGLIAFAEGIAVVGSFVPGSTLLVAIATCAGTGHVSLPLMIFWATLGAIAGDLLSFHLGRRHGARMLAMRPFAYRPEWTRRATELLERRGDVAVFVGRQVPPLRALMPVLAGMSGLRTRRFLASDALTSVVWAGLHLGLGAIIGHWVFALG